MASCQRRSITTPTAAHNHPRSRAVKASQQNPALPQSRSTVAWHKNFIPDSPAMRIMTFVCVTVQAAQEIQHRYQAGKLVMDQLVRYTPVFLLLIALTGCNSSEVSLPEDSTVPDTTAPDTDVPTGEQPDSLPNEGEVPGLADVDFDPAAPVDPLQTVVALSNDGAEQITNSTPASADIEIDSWQTFGNCSVVDEGIAAGNGDHAFRLGTGCELQQLTSATYSTGDSASVIFEAQGTESDQLTIELLKVNAQGQVVVVAQRNIQFGVGADRWRTYQALFQHGIGDTAAGDRFGIRVRHSDVLADNPIYIDSIAISLFQPSENTATQFTATQFSDQWDGVCDQIWTGEHYWANRLRDWHVLDGKVQTRNVDTFRPYRTLHRVATVVSETAADFSLQIDTGATANNGGNALHGFLLGAGTRMDYRGASLVHNRSGLNGGIILAVDAQGRAIINDNGIDQKTLASGSISDSPGTQGVRLVLNATYENSGDYLLDLSVLDNNGNLLSATNTRVAPARLLGNVALIANAGSEQTVHWFNNFSGSGAKLREISQREFGPVLFSSYTVSRNILSLNAQFPPVCASQTETPELQVAQGGQWVTIAQAEIDPQSYTALFRVNDWDASQRAHYRVASSFNRNNANDAAAATTTQQYFYHGTIQADPIDSDEFVMGVFNCRPGVILSDTEGWIQQNNQKSFTWTRERIVVPHEELLANAAKHQSHLIAFLGDQIYEFDPNGFIDKTSTEATIEDYFWKWYQFGWAVRDLTRNTPSFVIPDDHDVFQGNIWGQGGRAAATENEGGYVFPAEFVQIVQRTQTGSLPPAFDPTPVEQNIDVYYTDMVYGEVGFAILEDRKFKTGPDSAETTQRLLGERQLAFLDSWARDWKGHSMKLAVSQSPFAQSTTHSGAGFNRIGHDQDSNGWPAIGRDKAVAALRRAYAPHISGDQHLGMTLQHGIDDFNDAVFSFSGPSMLNIFPRIWDPRNPVNGPGDPAVGYRGNWTDKHGNLISVLAAANPNSYYQPVVPDTVAEKDDLGIGYGIVRINKQTNEYTFEAWPADQDPNDPLASPYNFWPITIKQADNDGRTVTGALPTRVAAVDKPVVEVVNEQSGELIYARRFTTPTINAPVYDNSATYTLTLSDPDSGYTETFHAQQVQ